MCFHKWNKWEQYDRHYQFTPGLLTPKAIHGKIFDGVERRQKRAYQKCGKIQDEKVSDE